MRKSKTEKQREDLWQNDILFCPDKAGGGSELSDEAVVNVLVGSLFPERMRDVLLDRYGAMKKNFSHSADDTSNWLPENRYRRHCSIAGVCEHPDMLLEVRQSFFNAKSADDLEKRWHYMLSYPCIGHDLPVWLHKKGVKAPRRVMIVSQDPLRKGLGRGKLTISSPWALHSPLYRQKIKNNLVFKVIEELLERGVALYLTDYAKVYFPPLERRSCCWQCVLADGIFEESDANEEYARVKVQFDCRYADVLKEELRRFNPELIVTFGNKATTSVFKIKEFSACRAISVPHPSAMRFGNRSYGGRQYSPEDYCKKVLGEIDAQFAKEEKK